MKTLPNDRQRDLALADACVGGSKSAWAELATRHRVDVRGAILRTLVAYGRRPHEELVEDLESSVFLRIAVNDFHRLRSYRGEASLAGWLKVMATNATIDHLRSLRRMVALDDVDPFALVDPRPGADEAMHAQQIGEALRELYAALNPADAEFVDLYFIRELSFDEIAERTSTTHGALYARKTRIRRRLLELARGRATADLTRASGSMG